MSADSTIVFQPFKLPLGRLSLKFVYIKIRISGKSHRWLATTKEQIFNLLTEAENNPLFAAMPLSEWEQARQQIAHLPLPASGASPHAKKVSLPS